jgi:hypothetical protein
MNRIAQFSKNSKILLFKILYNFIKKKLCLAIYLKLLYLRNKML